ADMRMIDHAHIEIARQFLDRKSLEILQGAPFPFDLDALVAQPLLRTGHHRTVAAPLTPGPASQLDRTHSPNSSRIALLFSPMRGAARSTLWRCPLMRSGERVVVMETLSSRVTVCSMSRTEKPSLAKSSSQLRTRAHQISAGSRM